MKNVIREKAQKVVPRVGCSYQLAILVISIDREVDVCARFLESVYFYQRNLFISDFQKKKRILR